MDYRVEQLAAACDISVDTVRFYQSRGLLPAPRREGRVALYGPEHLERVQSIRDLQAKGLTLAVIARVLEGSLDHGDADLAAAVASAQSEDEPAEEFLTIDQVAALSGVPSGLLRAVERAGLRLGRRVDGEERFTRADVDLVKQGMRLLEAGLPLDALLEIATAYDAAARTVAARAVELFDTHVRGPVHASGVPGDEAAERLVAAFRELLPAVTGLVAHHFRRTLLALAEEHIERGGDEAEIAATRAEGRRLREPVWPG